MKTPLSKEKLLLFGLPVAGLLLGLLGYVALVAPQKSRAHSLDVQLTVAQIALVAAHQEPSKPAPVRASDIFRLTKAMPDSNDMPGILRHLSRLARASAVSLDTVRPSPQIPLTQGYAALPVAVSVSGKFAAVSKFLELLRRQAAVTKGRLLVDGRLFVANQIALTSTDGTSVSATLNLDAFVYGGAPPSAPAGPPGAAGTTTTGTTTTPAAPTGSAG